MLASAVVGYTIVIYIDIINNVTGLLLSYCIDIIFVIISIIIVDVAVVIIILV